jgi:(R,R)-butanediol dehydrogenase/meso-butanediol dehydrogenase/diacetyl reductase
MLYGLPDTLTYEQGALVEPLATSFHGVRQSRFKPGDTAVVIGAGPIGLGVLQILQISAASRIIALEVAPERARIALKAGADVALNPVEEGDQLAAKIIELTDGLGAHQIYECSGVPAALQSALNYVRSGGQIMIIGVNNKETPIVPLIVLSKEAEIRGSMCYTGTEFQMVIDLLQRQRLNTDLMLSDAISLNEIEEKGFRRLMTSPEAVKIIVKP